MQHLDSTEAAQPGARQSAPSSPAAVRMLVRRDRDTAAIWAGTDLAPGQSVSAYLRLCAPGAFVWRAKASCSAMDEASATFDQGGWHWCATLRAADPCAEITRLNTLYAAVLDAAASDAAMIEVPQHLSAVLRSLLDHTGHGKLVFCSRTQ